ncbi:RNA polymerase sigma factor (sigma-70 family) [Streptomyces achromogenes]|uniref:RNA polymerase sigma factor (Sigma-70 family) n=1 Tax=Streptomyces achromogenes TaxID=67255 RepID=A0ABU0QE34_STRAH|nr:sigma-70 family RNA polymerase sigma factor [Streptomyces achromogenes]MDQ0688923.1 RNA polymerase sigma factor (sigma-70 family) [Streptomyces achromogenes]
MTTSGEPTDADPPVDLSVGGVEDRAAERTAVDAEFSAFYRADFSRLVGFLILVGAGREDAADAAQETMRKLHQKWREVRHPKTWARTTGRRVLIRALRSPREQDLGESPEPAAGHLVGDHAMWESLECDEVLAILRELPPCQRQALALTFDAFSPAEIAQILDVPAVQVRGNLARARRTAVTVLEKRKRERQ